jgi:4-hydroxybenzoate polyprenyltransferase
MKKVIETLLFSNSFYGIAAVLLAIESNLLSGLSLNHPALYILLFSGTVVFYSFSYNYDPKPLPGNQRTLWIKRNKKAFIQFQLLLIVISVIAALWYYKSLIALPPRQLISIFLLLSVFPLLGMLYYGIAFPGLFNIKLRQFGWFKPFIIGAVWAGCISFMPWLMKQWENGGFVLPTSRIIFLWLHNFMFISVLAILFDVKDYAADHNHALKTFVVRVGLKKVILGIVLPLAAIGFFCLWMVLGLKSMASPAIIFLSIPILALAWVALNMNKKRPIKWYLFVIDGLMPLKAVCGIIAGVWI